MQPSDTLAREAQPEEWRPVVGYEGLYEVSSLGRVRRMAFVCGATGSRHPYAKPKVISQAIKRSYPTVHLCNRGSRYAPVSVLICQAWHGPKPSAAHQAAHGDGIKTHNYPHNLRWATPAENQADRNKHGTSCLGSRHANAKLTEDQVLSIRARRPHVKLQDLADEYGVNNSLISAIEHRRAWKHI